MDTFIATSTMKRELGADIGITIDYNDVAGYTSGAAQALLSVKAGTIVQVVGMKLNTAFDRSGTGALAVTVGDGDSATALQASTVIAVDGTEILYHVGGSPKAYLADDTVDAFFTDAGGMTYTSGSVTFYLKVVNLNEMPTA